MTAHILLEEQQADQGGWSHQQDTAGDTGAVSEPLAL